jgi:hypothetical protein
MSLPAALAAIPIVRRTYTYRDGTAVSGGVILLTLTTTVDVGLASVVPKQIRITLDGSGQIPADLTLASTNDPDASVIGLAYWVEETWEGGRRGSLTVAYDATDVDLADLVGPVGTPTYAAAVAAAASADAASDSADEAAASAAEAAASAAAAGEASVTNATVNAAIEDDPAATRTSLALGSLATQDGTFSGTSSGTNTGDQTTITGNAGTATALATARNIDGQAFDGTANITVIAPGTHVATGKSTPVDADELPLVDSAASNALKKLTWANLKATLKTYLDTLYAPIGRTVAIGIACSDETTALTTGTAKATFRMPYAMTLTAVRASVNTAPTGSVLTVDINEAGTTILSTKLTIDASEKTSTTAATPAVISDSALADDAEITIDIDGVGSTIAGKGLKVWLIGTR